MADGGSQGVRRVVWVRLVIERQNVSDHVHDLALVCRARAHDSLLNLHGRVLAHLKAGVCAGNDGNAAGLGRCDGALGVLSEVDVLYGERRGAKAGNDLRELVIYLAETLGDGLAGARHHTAVRTGAACGTARLNDAPARVGQARVNSKDNHRRTPSLFSPSALLILERAFLD